MTRHKAKPDKPAGKQAPPPLEPIDVVDGVPDRAPSSRPWQYAVLALIFAAWVAFLLYCQMAGRPSP